MFALEATRNFQNETAIAALSAIQAMKRLFPITDARLHLLRAVRPAASADEKNGRVVLEEKTRGASFDELAQLTNAPCLR